MRAFLLLFLIACSSVFAQTDEEYNYELELHMSRMAAVDLIKNTFHPEEILFLKEECIIEYLNFDNSVIERRSLKDNETLSLLKKNKVVPDSYTLFFKIKNKFDEEIVVKTKCDRDGNVIAPEKFKKEKNKEYNAFNRKYTLSIQKALALLQSAYPDFTIESAPSMSYDTVYRDRICYIFKLSKSDTVVEIFVDVKTGCFYKNR